MMTHTEIQECARFMSQTADATFHSLFRHLEAFMYRKGVELTDEEKVQLANMLRSLDGHRCEQFRHLMQLAQDALAIAPSPAYTLVDKSKASA